MSRSPPGTEKGSALPQAIKRSIGEKATRKKKKKLNSTGMNSKGRVLVEPNFLNGAVGPRRQEDKLIS